MEQQAMWFFWSILKAKKKCFAKYENATLRNLHDFM